MFKINKRYAALGESFFTFLNPSALENPRLVHMNSELLHSLGLSELTENSWLDIVSGAQTIPGYSPLASVYAGHQFGHLVPQLGDGRALLAAEHQDPAGKVWELQLKGGGKTPYSRMGDGRAVLRSSLREYLASYAMRALGVPTTEALAIVTSTTKVYREPIG